MGGTMVPRLPKEKETVLTQKGTCLATNSSSLPMSLRKNCLQRHVLEMIVTRLCYQGFLFQFLAVLV